VIRFGIAGGAHPHVGAFLAEAAARDDVRLVGAWDPDPGVAASLAGAPFPSLQAMLEADLGAVAIAAVYADRADLAAAFLRRGVHVAVDKPMAVTTAALDRIEAAAAASAAHLSLILDKRADPVTRAAMRMHADGVVGDIAAVSATAPHRLRAATRPAWFFRRQSYGGILSDILTHDIDLGLQFSGLTRGVVTAHAGNLAHPEHPEFEDHGSALFGGDRGPTLSLDAHWLSPDGALADDYRMRLVGTEGTAELLWGSGVLVVETRSGRHRYTPPRERRGAAQEFFDAVRDGRAPECDTARSIAVSRIALQAQRSADLGRTEAWDTGPGLAAAQ
jgi:predicted dehydrogenase